MANVTDLRIDLAAQFTGKTAFDKAQASTAKLERSVKNLGKTLGFTLGTAAIVRFGKSAANAFIQDEKAASVLANTMKNLGLQMSAPTMERYIQSLELATGVVDDQLRPAMQSLLQVTGSVINSQKILAQAIEVSRATGVELTTVAQDLGQAYVGNTRGLRKYSLGLTQAELKAASFADIQTRLTTLFGGANEAYLNTYAGQMERLGVAAGEAKETIGKGLVDALITLSGSKGIDDLVSKMNTVAQVTSNIIGSISRFIAFTGGVFTGKDSKALAEQIYGKKGDKSAVIPSISAMVQQAQQAKAEKAALARAKELQKATVATTNSKKQQLVLEKARAALAKAQANFDITKINLAAALKGKVSEEDRKRLLALQAIENGNGELALEWIKKLDYQRMLAAQAEEERQRKLGEAILAVQLLVANTIAKISALSEESTNSAINRYERLTMTAAQALAAVLSANARASSGVAGYSGVGSGLYDQITNPFAGTYYGETGRDPMPVINVNVAGSVTTENDLVASITNALYNNQASGVPVNYSTVY